MKSIIISGSGKRVGKTLLATHLVGKLKKCNKKVVVFKVKRTAEGKLSIRKGPGRDNSDTSRYSEAGANRVAYIQFSTEQELKGIIEKNVLDFADIVIYESNSLRSVLKPNLLVYLTDNSGNCKNPELKTLADVVCEEVLTEEIAGKTADTITGLLGCGTFTLGGKYWISKNEQRLFGEGIFRLLRTVGETGSIHRASQKTGIPYKRAWTLINETEQKLGAKLLLSNRGGAFGGGSTLTPLAGKLLDAFEIAAGSFKKFKHGLEI